MLHVRVRPFLRRFLVSYLTILLIPVLMSVLIYRSGTTIIHSYVEDSNLTLISQAGYALDQRLNNLRKLVLRSSVNSQFDALSNKTRPLPPTFHIDLNLEVKRLRPTFLADEMVTDFLIYLTASDYIIDSDSIVSGDLFFRYSFCYDDWSKADWLSFLTSKYHRGTALPAALVASDQDSYVAVPIIWSVPFYLNTSNRTFVIFLISQEDIFDYFHPHAGDPGGYLSIFDGDGNLIISSVTGELQAETESLITVRTRSEMFDFEYELSIPEDRVYERLRLIRKIMLMSTAAAMVLGVLAAVWFSSVNARPLRSMASLLAEQIDRPQPTDGRRRSNPFEVLNRSVRELIGRNESLRNRISDQRVVIQEVFFYRLLKEGFSSRSEMTAMKRYLDVPDEPGIHGVALLNFLREEEIVNEQTLEETKALKILMLDSIRHESVYPRSWVDVGENSVALLLTHRGSKPEEWERKIDAEIGRIAVKIERAAPFPVFWTIGNPVKDFMNLHISYQQAHELSRMLPAEQRSGVHRYGEFASNRSEYYLPMDFLKRLFNLARAGDFESLRSLFCENWRENTEARNLSPMALEQYLFDYRGLVFRLDICDRESPLFDGFRDIELPGTKEAILESLRGYCERVKSEKKDNNNRFKDEIIEYMVARYADVSMSLHSVASHFNISEGYLSHFFKRYNGTNFYTFLENIRLEHAAANLKASGKPIKEIACDAGYGNVHSFRRAFKRVYGISPSLYREM